MPASLLADVRFALRSLWHRKGFAGVAIVTAGLAIGITTAVHSTLDWMLYRSPTGVVDPERLVALRVTDGQVDSGIALPQYQAIQDTQDVFTDLAVLFKIPGIVGTDHRSDQPSC
jgi:hypothetical protein